MASYFEIMDNINKSRNTPGGYRGMGDVPVLQNCTALPFDAQYQCSLANDALIQQSGGHVYWSGPNYTSSSNPDPTTSNAQPSGKGVVFTNPRGGNGATLYPGDVWTIDVYGNAGGVVSNHVVFPDGGTSNTPDYGRADASGHWAITGTIQNEQPGLWQETWSVDNQVVGYFQFTVAKPQTSAPPPPPAPPPTPNPTNPLTPPNNYKPPTGPAPTYNMVINFATNRGGNTLYVGDTWQITIQGAPPNTQVTNTVGSSTTPYGNTDANGNWTMSGTFGVNDIAVWQETWKVGNAIAGIWNFTVLAAPAPTTSGTTSGSTNPPTPTDTNVTGATGSTGTTVGQTGTTTAGQASSQTALGANFQDVLTGEIVSGVPNWMLLLGGALVIMFMSSGGGGGYRR